MMGQQMDLMMDFESWKELQKDSKWDKKRDTVYVKGLLMDSLKVYQLLMVW